MLAVKGDVEPRTNDLLDSLVHLIVRSTKSFVAAFLLRFLPTLPFVENVAEETDFLFQVRSWSKSYTHSSRFVTTPSENSLKIVAAPLCALPALASLLATGINSSQSFFGQVEPVVMFVGVDGLKLRFRRTSSSAGTASLSRCAIPFPGRRA